MPGSAYNGLDPRSRGYWAMRREVNFGFHESSSQDQDEARTRSCKHVGRRLYRSGPGKQWKAAQRGSTSLFSDRSDRHGPSGCDGARNYRERRLLPPVTTLALRMWRAGADGSEAASENVRGRDRRWSHTYYRRTKLLVQTLNKLGYLTTTLFTLPLELGHEIAQHNQTSLRDLWQRQKCGTEPRWW